MIKLNTEMKHLFLGILKALIILWVSCAGYELLYTSLKGDVAFYSGWWGFPWFITSVVLIFLCIPYQIATYDKEIERMKEME